MAMGVADLEGIAAAGDKEQYPVRIGRCSTFFQLVLFNFYPGCYVCVFVTLCRMV
jgi:hypothetical protein